MAQETDKILIRKFIAGNCSPREQQQVKLFLEQPGSRELFDQVMEEDWRDFRKQNPATDEYILEFQGRLNRRIEQSALTPVSKIRSSNFFRYAAIWTVMILGVAGYGLWQFNKSSPERLTSVMVSSRNPSGQRSKVTLSDGSIVSLGPASSISYPERFAGDSREISLQGEAFFEITRNPKRPFIIHTGQMQTKVLGTSFKIEAFNGEGITVAVATGKVQVSRKFPASSKVESLATLVPGEAVGYDPVTGRSTISNIATDALTGWKQGRLSFRGTPLSEILLVLGRWYNVKIDLRNREIGKYRMNIQLDGKQGLNQSLEILKATTKAAYQIKGNTVIIQ